jgi:putative tryptophan/tyrosine transport system substrate-binding protein
MWELALLLPLIQGLHWTPLNVDLRRSRFPNDCTRNPFRDIGVPKANEVKNILLIVLTITLLALTGGFAGAQQATKVPRIGYLGLGDPSSALFKSFRQGLRELGYIEGQSIIIEPRFTYGNDWRLRGLAAELAGLKMDVIVAQPPAIRATTSATTTIPIVAEFAIDPVFDGIVTSLLRPGGNVTGVSALTLELGGKWLELIRETIPNVKRVIVFWNRPAENSFPVWKSVESTARSLGVDLRWEEVGSGSYGSGLHFLYRRLEGASLRQAADAFIVLPPIRNFEEDIADFGLRNRIPGIFWRTDLDIERMGGLMAYGVNRFEQSRRAAYVVDKILKGAKAGDLPIERPTQFELVINLKTAKEIGVTIPPDMLMFADRVIK